jgi:hypothetical protein
MLPALCFSFISGRRWWSAHDDTLSLFDQQYENTKEAETTTPKKRLKTDITFSNVSCDATAKTARSEIVDGKRKFRKK